MQYSQKRLSNFQYGKNENSFIGIYIYSDREYIQTRLIQKLSKDKFYCVSFYVNLADLSTVAIDKIGIFFSSDTLKPLVLNGLIDEIPNISNDFGSIIKDTVNWVQISEKFKANGDEQFLTIGNFFSDENTLYEILDTSIIHAKFAYYFIDDVSVYECEEEPTNVISIPNAFTPNGDGVNDVFKVHGQNIKTISGKIINRWGQELYKWNTLDDG